MTNRVTVEEVRNMAHAMREAKKTGRLVEEFADRLDECTRLVVDGTKQGLAEKDRELVCAVERLSRLDCDLIAEACSRPLGAGI